MSAPQPIVASIEVDAPADVVWRLVSDVRRMGEWSPECRRVFVLGSREPGLGSRMLGINRRGLVVWPTLSRIVRFEAGRSIAWRTRESGATWTYEIEEAPDAASRPGSPGCALRGSRELARYSPLTRVAGPLIGGATGHDRELASGIRVTLARIKAVAERAAQPAA